LESKKLVCFGEVLAAKSLWRGLHKENLWGEILKIKYWKSLNLELWLQQENKSIRGASVVWQGFYKAVPVIEKWMAWCLGNGANIRLGEDLIIGSNHFFELPSQLVNYLRMGGVTHLTPKYPF